MNGNEMMSICFDKFKIPIHTDTVKRLIREEIAQLSRKTGLPGDRRPIIFVEDQTPELACFVYDGSGRGRPLYFQFSLPWMSKLSAHQIVDTVRHEFAHYVRLVRHGITREKGGHDKKWMEICVELGCAPDRYHHEHLTRILFP